MHIEDCLQGSIVCETIKIYTSSISASTMIKRQQFIPVRLGSLHGDMIPIYGTGTGRTGRKIRCAAPFPDILNEKLRIPEKQIQEDRRIAFHDA